MVAVGIRRVQRRAPWFPFKAQNLRDPILVLAVPLQDQYMLCIEHHFHHQVHNRYLNSKSTAKWQEKQYRKISSLEQDKTNNVQDKPIVSAIPKYKRLNFHNT